MNAVHIVIFCLAIAFQALAQDFYYQPNYNKQNTYKNADLSTYDQTYQQNFAVQPKQSAYSCPAEDARYPTGTCDEYIECQHGYGEAKLCPEGLYFNPNLPFTSYPCSYPNEVDCGGRGSVQHAQPTDECPHQFGYYRLGDASNCGQYLNCAHGKAYYYNCPEGLAFNEETNRCDWPDEVKSCDAEAYLGFTCPPDARSYGLGKEADRFYKHPHDCSKFFTCVHGRPRLNTCEKGKAFSEATNSCEKAEEVSGCYAPDIPHQILRRY